MNTQSFQDWCWYASTCRKYLQSITQNTPSIYVFATENDKVWWYMYLALKNVSKHVTKTQRMFLRYSVIPGIYIFLQKSIKWDIAPFIKQFVITFQFWKIKCLTRHHTKKRIRYYTYCNCNVIKKQEENDLPGRGFPLRGNSILMFYRATNNTVECVFQPRRKN